MIIDSLLQFILFGEASICVLLAVPVTHGVVLKVLEASSKLQSTRFAQAFDIGFSMVCLLFLMNAATAWHLGGEDENLADSMRIRQLRASRDAYVAGADLFLYLMLRLLASTTREMLNVKARAEAMERQGRSASDAFAKLLEEKEKGERAVSALKLARPGSGAAAMAGEDEDDSADEGDDALLDADESDAKRLVAAAEAKVRELEKELKSAETNVSAMKQQADNQSSMLMKVMDEKASLQKQLRDFEDIVGEKGKKER